MNAKLEKFYEMIEGMETAMFTTRRGDGHLVSRPMATQKRSEGADLWFVTYRGADKIREVRGDAHVNLAYYKDRTREWISVSGKARIVDDRAKIYELYAPDWKAWFGDEGGAMDGTPDDPRMILIAVNIDSAVYLELNKPQPVVLFEVLKGIVTGTPRIGKTRHIRASEARTARPGSKRPTVRTSAVKRGSAKKSAKGKPAPRRGSKGSTARRVSRKKPAR